MEKKWDEQTIYLDSIGEEIRCQRYRDWDLYLGPHHPPKRRSFRRGRRERPSFLPSTARRSEACREITGCHLIGSRSYRSVWYNWPTLKETGHALSSLHLHAPLKPDHRSSPMDGPRSFRRSSLQQPPNLPRAVSRPTFPLLLFFLWHSSFLQFLLLLLRRKPSRRALKKIFDAARWTAR